MSKIWKKERKKVDRCERLNLEITNQIQGLIYEIDELQAEVVKMEYLHK